MRTVIELLCFFDHYMEKHMLVDFDGICGITFDEAIHELAVDGGSASIWALCGLSSVIRRQIRSVYPRSINGDSDAVALTLNTLLSPRISCDQVEPVVIMWTRSDPPNSRGMWLCNHFVPLVRAAACSQARGEIRQVTSVL